MLGICVYVTSGFVSVSGGCYLYLCVCGCVGGRGYLCICVSGRVGGGRLLVYLCVCGCVGGRGSLCVFVCLLVYWEEGLLVYLCVCGRVGGEVTCVFVSVSV